MRHNENLEDAEQRQIELEQEALSFGRDRYNATRPMPWRDQGQAPKRRSEADLSPGITFLSITTAPVAEAVKAFNEAMRTKGVGRRPDAYKILNKLRPEAAAYLTGRVLIDMITGDETRFSTVASAIGARLVDHIEMANLEAIDPKVHKTITGNAKRRNVSHRIQKYIREIIANHDADEQFSVETRIAAGMKMIEIFCDITGHFRLIRKQNRTNKGFTYHVAATDEFVAWLDKQHGRCEILSPIHTAMVCPPRPWEGPTGGGYLCSSLRLVKRRSRAYHDRLADVDMPVVYEALNAIQATRWRINKNVLSVVHQIWREGGSLGGLPHRLALPIPEQPADIATNQQARANWKREAAAIHDQNHKTVARRLALHQMIWTADKLANEDAIWFPASLDFRGRVYPSVTAGPSPQGGDLSRPFLEFADGMPLGERGAYWLAVHLANQFGMDKQPFDDRVQWVHDHGHLIADSADKPIDGHRFWTAADKPYAALAACFEWAGYQREGEAFVSHLPIALDGTCSGIQHFSALLRDEIGGAAVNLTPSDRPQDVYSVVAAKAETLNAAPEWVGKINRKIAKGPTMTLVYSATRWGFQEQIIETLRKIDADNEARGLPPHLGGARPYYAAIPMSHTLHEAISQTVVKAVEGMAWLKSVAKLTDQPIMWTTPAGFPVLQHYPRNNKKRLSVYIGPKKKSIEVQIAVPGDPNITVASRQIAGIAPNFIHSCDASHLMSVAAECAAVSIRHLACIHDSFGTHAANTDRLATILRETFVAQYTPDVLANFRQELIDQLPSEIAASIPPLPAYGQLNIPTILRSEYLFS